MTTTTYIPFPPAGRLAGSWRIDSVASHARFTARTMAGLFRVPGRFRILAGTISLDERGTSGALLRRAR
jgi:polyisoprenoid-binding protein YceI